MLGLEGHRGRKELRTEPQGLKDLRVPREVVPKDHRGLLACKGRLDHRGLKEVRALRDSKEQGRKGRKVLKVPKVRKVLQQLPGLKAHRVHKEW